MSSRPMMRQPPMPQFASGKLCKSYIIVQTHIESIQEGLHLSMLPHNHHAEDLVNDTWDNPLVHLHHLKWVQCMEEVHRTLTILLVKQVLRLSVRF